MNQKKVAIILVVVTIASCLFTIRSIPKRTGLNTTKEQLSEVKKQIKEKRKEVKKNSPLSNDFNLVSTQREVQNNLKHAFEVTYGGLHSKEDLNTNMAMLERTLGTKLTKEIIENIHRQDNFFVSKNDSTTVAFENVTDKTDAIIHVTIRYEVNGTTEEKEEQAKTYSQVYTLHYNLLNKRVLSYENERLVQN